MSDTDVSEETLKMAKYEFLIFTLIVLLPLCVAVDFSGIFLKGESFINFEKKLEDRGLPLVSETYELYQSRMSASGKSDQCITVNDFKVFMDSLPRVYETAESVNMRNGLIQVEKGGYEFQYYDDDLITWLHTSYYPRLYEDYEEYTSRISQVNGGVLVSIEMFTALKQFNPIYGEDYNEYQSRANNSGFSPWSEEDFNSFMKLYPTKGEESAHYLDRIANMKTNSKGTHKWIDMTKEDYEGLKIFFPRDGEVYDDYVERLEKYRVTPLDEEMFNSYQPNQTT